MTTPFSLTRDGDKWVAHSLAFDIVAVADDGFEATDKLKTLLAAQIGFGRHRGISLRHCYFAAPPEDWVTPFSFIEMPSENDIADITFRGVSGDK